MSIANTIRKKVLSLLAAGTSFTMAACYGVTSPSYYTSGTVRDRQTGAALPEIEVCVTQETYRECVVTDDTGAFGFQVSSSMHEKPYEICAHEKAEESPYGGIYEEACHTMLPENDVLHVDFFLTRRE